MAMRTASPWWLSVVFGFGLICTLVGERLLSQVSGVHFLLSGVLGVGLMLVVTGARAWTTATTTGSRQRVERTLLIAHLGTLLALVIYALTTDWGMGLLGIKNTERFSGALTVLYGVLLLVSIVRLTSGILASFEGWSVSEIRAGEQVLFLPAGEYREVAFDLVVAGCRIPGAIAHP